MYLSFEKHVDTNLVINIADMVRTTQYKVKTQVGISIFHKVGLSRVVRLSVRYK